MGLRLLRFAPRTPDCASNSHDSSSRSISSKTPPLHLLISPEARTHLEAFLQLENASPERAKAIHAIVVKALQRCECDRAAGAPPPQYE